jgi:hypothetical protein
MTAALFMPNSSEGRIPNPEAAMHDFANDDSFVASLEKQMRSIWSARFLIALCDRRRVGWLFRCDIVAEDA